VNRIDEIEAIAQQRLLSRNPHQYGTTRRR
jgi:hypothetical protein